MRIGVLGGGSVGQTLGTGFAWAQEAFVVIWVRLWMTGGTPFVNYRIAKA